jgi:hypothetical protein
MTMPCLVYCGERDDRHDGARRCAAELPRGSLLSLSSLDHMEAMVRSRVLVPRVLSFLEGVSAA